MGFFSFWGNLFGGKVSAKDAEEIQKEISFADAIAAHSGWKKRLDDYVGDKSAETLDPAIICQDNRCVLGKWIHGHGLKRFGQDASFGALRADHATFHYHAAKVVELHQAGKTADARDVMAKDYANASRKVIGALLELNQAFGGSKKV